VSSIYPQSLSSPVEIFCCDWASVVPICDGRNGCSTWFRQPVGRPSDRTRPHQLGRLARPFSLRVSSDRCDQNDPAFVACRHYLRLASEGMVVLRITFAMMKLARKQIAPPRQWVAFVKDKVGHSHRASDLVATQPLARANCRKASPHCGYFLRVSRDDPAPWSAGRKEREGPCPIP
jgi:hypothetical protein